ncbi:MAG: malto-oligosyltrehalose synthase, partial [Rhodothermales bacterium]
ITQARPGSRHGYDVIDHNAIREEVGGREGFARLTRAATEHGLKIILDFVPNHAGVGPRNAYWQDVLAYGPHSPFAPYFDIDWNPIKPELQGKILLPNLGRPYGEALDEGELSLAYDDGYLYATYYENRYRLNPATYTDILEAAMRAAERTEPYWDLKDLHDAYHTLAPQERDKAEALRMRLVALFDRIDPGEVLSAFDGDQLHDLFQRQFWRLSFWKTAGSEINYRRFFDINELVALRMEDDHVFWDAHQLLAELLAMEAVDGVRIDHIDGLYDPHDYLERLENVSGGRIWVEKILAAGETLPDEWPVEGTTGYEFLNDVMGVLLQKEGRIPLEKICRRHVGTYRPFDDEVYASKKIVIETSLSSELLRLSYELDRISEADYHTRDFTLEAIRQALTEIVAVFRRYRTYLPYETDTAQEVIQRAVHRARARNPVAEPTVYDFVADVILGNVRNDLEPVRRAWVGRFQQYTAPVAAKGVEDTAFYRYLPLVALNEVGGEPDEFGASLHAFHAHARFRAHRYPEGLVATATHDHKRGEDTRMRLIALAEVPDLWEEAVRSLRQIGEDYVVDGSPSRSDRYLFFQTLAGLWDESTATGPDDLEARLDAYMLKASRESKMQTSWTRPDESYEGALASFVRGVLRDERTAEAVEALAGRLRQLGFVNSISQLVLKLTTPGVPDIYQGTELFDFSLVDPDNRRPVDYERRAALLDELSGLIEAPNYPSVERLADGRDERAKLFVTAALLRLRHRRPELMKGDYQPIEVGEDSGWIAFVLSHETSHLLVAVPRFPTSFLANAAERPAARISLPDGLAGRRWIDVLTGRRLETGTDLETFSAPFPWMVLASE